MTLDPLYQVLGQILAFFYNFIPSLGIGIILLTIIIMLLLFPLTAKQARSMLAMQRLQPEMKKLQAKYKGDRQKLNEEVMKLYQEHKVNPLGGCLPLLLQMPILFGLYRFIREAYRHVPTDSELFKAFCPHGQSVKECGKAISAHGFPGSMDFLGMNLAQKATDPHGGFLYALPYFVLVGLVVVTGFIQSKQTQRNTPPGANTQAQMIGRIMPVFFGAISLTFPAGLVLYFFVSNAWRVGQQELIMRKIAPHDAGKAGAIDVKSSSDSGAEAKGGGAKGREPTALGGLRALFRPPPADNGDTQPKPAKPPPKPASSKPKPSTSGRPGAARSQRRRSSNKKRKR